ncbi:MAG: NAD-dependent epimerase/dehydratase family protein [Tistlia sp.]|uniref:NAD-dependent epimerase/dehydratase family protein n=1 Tax=Tistlia sp. TaxID=3057121 RepID=UPI0034A30608
MTGGCGFIGSHLVEELLALGKSVRVLDDLSTGRRDNVPASVEVIVGDVCDQAALARACQGVEGCFHLAAVASVQRCNEQWLSSHCTNLSAFVDLLDLARPRRGDFPVVFASSAAVYGMPEQLPLAETARTEPLSAYGADKLGCELHARAGAAVHGTRSVGLRFFNVYGPRQDPSSPYSGVISIFANRVVAGEPVTLFGDGLQSRDFVYVKDVVGALLASMDRAAGSKEPLFESVNVCTGRGTTVAGLAKALMAVAGGEVEIHFRPARAGDIRESVGNPVKMSSLLGLGRTTELETGLAALLASIDPGTRAGAAGEERWLARGHPAVSRLSAERRKRGFNGRPAAEAAEG